MTGTRVAGIGPKYYQGRKARTPKPAPQLSSSAPLYSTQKILRWQIFQPALLKEKSLDAARLTAMNEITQSLIQARSIPVLLEKIADGFNDILPSAGIEVEARSNILGKSFNGLTPKNFPALYQNGRSKLVSRLTREATTVEDVNKRMMGIPLVDSQKNLLAMVVLSFRADQLEVLKQARPYIEHLSQNASMIMENVVEREQLLKQSKTDALTQVWNRGYFDHRLEQEFERSTRHENPLSLMMLDIDHFKACNDTYGHQFGDKVLREFAAIIKKSVREEDDVARYGGEEFAVILPETGHSGAYKLAKRIREEVEAHKFVTDDGRTVPITVSIGVSSRSIHETPAELLGQADENLYAAKDCGRNSVKYN